jgi:hypothetical protein
MCPLPACILTVLSAASKDVLCVKPSCRCVVDSSDAHRQVGCPWLAPSIAHNLAVMESLGAGPSIAERPINAGRRPGNVDKPREGAVRVLWPIGMPLGVGLARR